MGCIYICSTLHWIIQLVKMHGDIEISSAELGSSGYFSVDILEKLFIMGPALLSISVRILVIYIRMIVIR
jgi:hypothetical protein